MFQSVGCLTTMMAVLLWCVFVGFFVAVSCVGDALIGEGVWDIIAVTPCENNDQYPYRFKVEKRKVDRTHDGFNAWIELDEVLDDSYAIRVDICKHCDGGCKDYQKLSDQSVVNFIKKFAEENMKTVLEMGGVDPPDFPVQPGRYEIEKFQLDKCEFPCKAVLGKFDAASFLLNKDNEELACLVTTVEFREPEDDEEMCDKCKD